MIEWEQVQQRIAAGEDERTEFIRGIGDLSGVGRTLAAFANSSGGLLVLGVDDHGAVVGVREPAEKVSERLSSFLQTGLSSPVQARLGRHEDASGWVHWVDVPRQRGYEPISHDGKVYVRRGRASVGPSPAELQELYNLFGYIVTEERAVSAAGVDSIDVQHFRTYLERLGLDLTGEPQPSREEDLRARGAVTEIGGDLRATVYGLLAFGKTPQSYPQTGNFRVECVAYLGDDRADEPFLVGDGSGRVDEQVERALGWFRGLGRFEQYVGTERRDVPLLPPAALREVLVNAVAHRDYAITGSKVLFEVFRDRVEVTSPGTLPNTMTVESVLRGGHPRSRNESMANYLLVMGRMEQRGRGWPVMRKAMREFNGTEPELDEDRSARFVRVTFRLLP